MVRIPPGVGLMLAVAPLLVRQPAAPPRPAPGADPLRIAALSASRIVNVSDRSLAEWDDSLLVLRVDHEAARGLQWTAINGRPPARLSQRDIGLKVYMATDRSYWYVAVDAVDDVVLGVPSSSVYPYSGDCLEIFFAGKNTESGADIHDHVSNPRASERQAAFFQLAIPPVALTDRAAHLPEWRTDARLRRGALSSGFAITAWKVRTGWRSEARIPLAAFDEDVRSSFRRHSSLKLHLDYLDYDTRIAPRSQAGFQGFNPDNVICLDREQTHVSVPRLMRSVVFD
jgi:hypothetical protein